MVQKFLEQNPTKYYCRHTVIDKRTTVTYIVRKTWKPRLWKNKKHHNYWRLISFTIAYFTNFFGCVCVWHPVEHMDTNLNHSYSIDVYSSMGKMYIYHTHLIISINLAYCITIWLLLLCGIYEYSWSKNF